MHTIKFKRFGLIMLALALLFIIACAGPVETPIDHLSLGERFLLEMNYEQALVHFLALIDIEPMNPRGYTGAAEAHIGLGQVDEAIAVLRLGQERLPDNVEIRGMLDGLVPTIPVVEPEIIEPEAEVEPETDEEVEDQHERLESILSEFARLLSIGEYYAVLEHLRNDVEFQELGNELLPAEFLPHIVNTEYGKIGIYIAETGGRFIYFGDFYGDVRQGHGVWISPMGISRGEWVADVPNGQFESHTHFPDGQSQFRLGNVVNGLWHGTIVWRQSNGTFQGYRSEQRDMGRIVPIGVSSWDADVLIIGHGCACGVCISSVGIYNCAPATRSTHTAPRGAPIWDSPIMSVPGFTP